MLQIYKQTVKSLVNPLLLTLTCFGQHVRAPEAQNLVDELMAGHPEMQTIGIHVTPSGWTRDLNIAGSKPGKVGKLSADIDIEVTKTGKSSLRLTPKGAYDMGLPLSDAAGRPLAMVVIVIRETFTGSQTVAMERASATRDELRAKIPSMQVLLNHAVLIPSKAAMVVQTPLPESKGEFGQFAADPVHRRLYLAAKEDRSIVVFNFEGEYLFDADRNQLYLTGTAGLAVYVVEKGTLRLDSKFPTMQSRISFYESSGKQLYAAHSKNSEDGAALQVYRIE